MKGRRIQSYHIFCILFFFHFTHRNKRLDPLVLLESMFCGCWALSMVLIACEACQRLSDSFGKVSDAFEQIDWYLLPIGIQRMIPATTLFAQEPVLVSFFGSSSCTREQFRKVSCETDKHVKLNCSFISFSV